jgi:hypothetical protein
MEELAHSFASLLRPMVDAVDRFGLKARHLRTHRPEAQELEGLRLAQAASFAVGRCETAELDQTGLVRMEAP